MNNRTIVTHVQPWLTALIGAGLCTLTLSACTEESPAPSNTGGTGNNAGSSNAGSSNAGSSNGGSGSGMDDAGADAAAPCVFDTDAVADCDEAIEIAGEYTDSFDGTVTIEDCAIYGAAVAAVSNDDQYFVQQNSCDAQFFPGKWSRFDWTWYSAVDGGEPALYICTTVYDADSEADAIAAPRADDSDPSSSGCGGMFPWTQLTPVGGAATDAGDGGD